MTDQAINLSGDKRIIETVVDSTYKTKSGALNKVLHCFYLQNTVTKYKIQGVCTNKPQKLNAAKVDKKTMSTCAEKGGSFVLKSYAAQLSVLSWKRKDWAFFFKTRCEFLLEKERKPQRWSFSIIYNVLQPGASLAVLLGGGQQHLGGRRLDRPPWRGDPAHRGQRPWDHELHYGGQAFLWSRYVHHSTHLLLLVGFYIDLKIIDNYLVPLFDSYWEEVWPLWHLMKWVERSICTVPGALWDNSGWEISF